MQMRSIQCNGDSSLNSNQPMKLGNVDQLWIKILLLHYPIFMFKMFSEAYFSVLFVCKMRLYATRLSCWNQQSKYQALPKSVYVYPMNCSWLETSVVLCSPDPSLPDPLCLHHEGLVCQTELNLIRVRTEQRWRWWKLVHSHIAGSFLTLAVVWIIKPIFANLLKSIFSI